MPVEVSGKVFEEGAGGEGRTLPRVAASYFVVSLLFPAPSRPLSRPITRASPHTRFALRLTSDRGASLGLWSWYRWRAVGSFSRR